MEINQLLFDVEQSQLIEHITPVRDSQLFQLHVKAAELVLSEISLDRIPKVRDVHRILTASTLTSAGSYRYLPVYIAGSDRDLPAPRSVSRLIEEWEVLCQDVLTFNSEDMAYREEFCIVFYYHFLCIHPFEDGNGRVGRLMYNALRRLAGLSWHTITMSEHLDHVVELRNYEDKVFRVDYPNVY